MLPLARTEDGSGFVEGKDLTDSKKTPGCAISYTGSPVHRVHIYLTASEF